MANQQTQSLAEIALLHYCTIALLQDAKLINEGVMAEQFIGQHLPSILAASPNRELTYWIREGRSSNAEVDYVIALNGNIVPIEVKPGATGSLKSLHQFVGEKSISCAVRFYAGLPSTQQIHIKITRDNKSIEVNYQLISLPLYFVELLPHLLN